MHVSKFLKKDKYVTYERPLDALESCEHNDASHVVNFVVTVLFLDLSCSTYST